MLADVIRPATKFFSGCDSYLASDSLEAFKSAKLSRKYERR